MPGRNIPIVTAEFYHIFNRGISFQPTFLNKRDYSRAKETGFFYQNKNLPVKYSRFLMLSNEERQSILENLRKKRQFLVDIVCYCLMPNHFHFLLRQNKENGIAKFISNFTNSYTRYFNTKNERRGPLFQGKFKAVRIETNEQLLHLSRYIHLNPYTSFLVKGLGEIETYSFSSLGEYLEKEGSNFCQKEIILDNFKNKHSYREFVFDQADYQRKLAKIKHLLLE